MRGVFLCLETCRRGLEGLLHRQRLMFEPRQNQPFARPMPSLEEQLGALDNPTVSRRKKAAVRITHSGHCHRVFGALAYAVSE